jgi:hypothetical protein
MPAGTGYTGSVTLAPDNLERTFAWLEHRLAGDPQWAREFLESRAVFFAHRSPRSVESDPLAHRRHLEWFLLERFSPARGGVPLEVLVHEARGAALEADEGEGTREQALAAMLASLTSVFLVTGVVPSEGVWVRDLAGGGEYALEEPEASHALEQGDLLVGRLFSVGDTLHRMSSAAGVFREERLREAVTRDLERARASRRGSLRLSQAELERMFWGDPDESAAGDAKARAREALLADGVPPELADAVLGELLSAPFDPSRVLPGAQDALGRALDRLAFETSADLARAREALLDAWTEQGRVQQAQAAAATAPRARPATEEVDVAAAMSAFDQGRREGRDLELLFRELERDLGLDELGDEEDEDAVRPVPDFPGAVGAVVEEYLWDLERRGEVELAREHACLRKLGEFGTSIGVFENLGARDLLVFGAVWLPELGQLSGADDARAVLAALESFCAWCDEAQDLPLSREFAQGAAELADSLPRLSEANRLRQSDAELTDGQVFEVREVAPGRLTLGDAQGDARAASADPRVTEHLRPGDRLRAEVDARGALRLYCCYPPESARIQPR